MNISDYWLMVMEYSIWNATIASLQFWTAYLNPFTLDSAMEEVYSVRNSISLEQNQFFSENTSFHQSN